MKQLFTILFLMLPCYVSAQDVIIKKDKSTIRCRVEEVTDSTVSYTPWGDPSETCYLIDKSHVSSINYENGKSETFRKKEKEKEKETRYYRHEVNVSIGRIGVRSGWSKSYENNVMDRFGLVVGKEGMGGVVYEWYDKTKLRGNMLKAVSYYYHFNHFIAVGGLFGFCNTKDWLGYPEVYKQDEKQKTGYTDVKGTSLFFLPSAKYSWMNSRWCSLYTKVSLGFHYQDMYLDSETIPKEQTDEYKRRHLSFAYYVTPIGWEIGKQKVRWFTEFGLGSNMNIQMGLTYRFRKF